MLTELRRRLAADRGATATGVPQRTISDWLSDSRTDAETAQPEALPGQAELDAIAEEIKAAAGAMTADAAALKQAVVIAIAARQLIDHAFKAAGRDPPTLEELRRLSPEFRDFERVAPVDWIPLIERAAQGDVEAIELLDVECERADLPVH